MNALRGFFTPEAGQRRRAWLEGVDGQIAGVLRNALGPQMYPPVEMAAQGMNMLAGGADHRDAVQSSGDLMRAQTGGEALRAGATMGAATLGAMMPGVSARAAGEGVQAARDVARMLREGRAADVTDDMMARVDPQEMHRLYESGGTGRAMPMDEASRMGRARDMGFEGGFYHGADGDMRGAAFDNWASGRVDSGFLGRGTYASESPSIASSYASRKADMPGAEDAPNIIPLALRQGRQASISPDQKQALSGMPPDDRMDWGYAQQGDGINSVRVTYGNRRGAPADEVVNYDPRNIRSRFARFDPRLSHLANLSAAGAGVATAGALGSQPDEGNWTQVRDYLRERGLLD